LVCTNGTLVCQGDLGPSVETCNGIDDDCDGTVDNGFDLLNDVRNCGTCGNDCTDLGRHPESQNATPWCNNGTCRRACKQDYWDADGVYANGCEYHCVYTGLEVCDGVDNDCDGLTDGADADMFIPPPFCRQQGACAGATHQCTTYTPSLVGESGDEEDQLSSWSIHGATEVNTDEGILYATLTYADPVRTVRLYRDPALDPQDLMAEGSASADGVITLAERNGSGLSGSVTVTFRAVDMEILYGLPITTLVCSYGSAVDVVGLNRIALQESRCDNQDNNCDGQVDEPFVQEHQKGSHCEQDGSWGPVVYGACRGYGRWVCEGCSDPSDPQSCTGTGTRLVCDMTCGLPTCKPQTAPTPETCDGVDNNCNGLVDEGAPDEMVHVVAPSPLNPSETLDFFIYAYEASRPDARHDARGVLEHRSCSKALVMPWSSVSQTEAREACAQAGKRLCTEEEWTAACSWDSAASAWRTYPYGNSYSPTACNGWDYDPDCQGANDNYALPTGTPYGCPPPASSA